MTSANAAPIPGYANAVGQDATSIYMASDDGFLRRIDKATMAVTTLAPVPAAFVDGIAVDDTDIYFTVLLGDHGEVWRLPKSGGSPVTFATGFEHPQGSRSTRSRSTWSTWEHLQSALRAMTA